MSNTMDHLFDKIGKRYLANGVWFRNDRYSDKLISIICLDQGDISPEPLRPDSRCNLCEAGIMHTEALHDDRRYNSDQ